ncbi:MAG TPA: IPT/TIG domain-containing protein [Pyrinomonadaceae bacterium]
MPSQNNPTDPNPPDPGNTPPGSSPMSRGWIAAVAIYLVIFSIVVLYGLIKLWPYPTPSGEAKAESSASQSESPTPTPTPVVNTQGKPTTTPTPAKELPDPETIYFFQGRVQAQVYLETRLLLLVMLSGALGSLMHSLRSLYWYTGNRMMVWSWVAFYLLLPVTGAILAIIFYFVVRGGFFSSTAQFQNTSPFGFAALSALVGLFSPQATLKLKEIAETIFAKPGEGTDNKPQETESQAPPTKPAPAITSLDTTSGKANDSIGITGTGFSEGVGVKFGGVTAVVSASSDTSITVVVPDNPSATAPVEVQVTNSDGQSVTAAQKFTYVAGADTSTPDEGTTDELEGDDEIKSNTTDEELPITEGGVG